MNEQSLTEMIIEVRDSVRDIKHNQDLLQQANQQTHSEVLRLRRIIVGESEPEKGLVIRVDRLEQQSRKSSALAQAALGTVVTAIIASIMAAIGFKR